ncbi:MAG: DUF5684 domain-containing protein [Microbacterium sp.]|uniref:DUF5684 domain-containing protein n=1 Tax=Microbacterium sp. TaxID=51671 RepID=UPI003A89B6D2
MNLISALTNVDIVPISASTGTGVSWTVVGIAYYILLAVAMWRTFSKAGWPGILAIIPIVNAFILVKVGGMSAWLGLLYLIPVVNIIFGIVVAVKVGANFGKGGAFSFFLLWLIAPIGYFIIGFGQARYTKPA